MWTLQVGRDFMAAPAAKGGQSARYWEGRIASAELVFRVSDAAGGAQAGRGTGAAARELLAIGPVATRVVCEAFGSSPDAAVRRRCKAIPSQIDAGDYLSHAETN